MAYDLIHHNGASLAYDAGKFNNALSVSADMSIGSYINPGYENATLASGIVDGSRNITGVMTVDGWFQLASGAPNWIPWFQSTIDTSSYGALAFEYAGGVTTLKAVGLYGDEVAGSMPSDIRGDGIFHHCAWVLTATTVTLYCDGVRIGTGTRSGSLAPDLRLPMNYRGLIDDLRISKSARYAGATYTVPTAAAVQDADTVAIYRFDGNILNDQSAPSNTPPSISTASLGSMNEGVAYSLVVSATGTSPITWLIVSGALPAGLSLNTSTGSITGTPTTASTGSVSIRATNDYGDDTEVYTWSVTTAPTPGVVTHTDANIFYQPYSWRTDVGSYHRALDQGSTLRVRVEGTHAIVINASGQGAYRVNQRSYVTFTGSVTVADLDSTRDSHDIEIIARDGSFQFTSLDVDTGCVTVPMHTSNIWGLAFGDSITRGAYGGTVDTAYQASYVWSLARVLGAEIGIVAENSRTYEAANTSGFQFADAWTIQVPGTSIPIDFSRPPDFMTLMVHAFSGQTGRIEATIQAILSALPATHVFAIRHIAVEATRLAGTNEAQAIFQGIQHPRFHYIDTSGWLRDIDDLPDSIHPTRDAQWTHLGPRLANEIRQYLSNNTATTSEVQVWNGTAWV